MGDVSEGAERMNMGENVSEDVRCMFEKVKCAQERIVREL